MAHHVSEHGRFAVPPCSQVSADDVGQIRAAVLLDLTDHRRNSLRRLARRFDGDEADSLAAGQRSDRDREPGRSPNGGGRRGRRDDVFD